METNQVNLLHLHQKEGNQAQAEAQTRQVHADGALGEATATGSLKDAAAEEATMAAKITVTAWTWTYFTVR